MSFDPRLAARQRASTRRTRLLLAVLALPFLAIGGRVGYLATGQEPQTKSIATAPEITRGEIRDRSGNVLATTVTLKSAYAQTDAIDDPVWTAMQLQSVMPDRILDVEALAERLSSGSGRQIPIARGLPPRLEQEIFNLGLPGLILIEEPKRIYPQQSIAGHVVGFTDVDLRGAAGAEAAFDDTLAAGEDVYLSLDLGLQTSLEEGLDWGFQTFRAAGAAGVLIDAHTGEILAMAGKPRFDPNHMPKLRPGAEINPVVHSTYEVGSVFKPLTVASGLEAGEVTLRETFDVSEGVKAGIRTFREKNTPAKPYTLTEVIAKSSNVGTVQIALAVGGRRQQDFMSALGLLEPVAIPLPGVAAPQTPRQVPWDALTTATTSFGHGINVTPLALAQAYVPFARGGEMVELRLQPLGEGELPLSRRVMANPTAQVVVEMMRETVQSGTARRLRSLGYDIAGKTGTANKNNSGGYDMSLRVTSFAAIMPADAPRYVLYVLLDEPEVGINQDEQADAGRTAVPTAGRIIERIAPILNLPPIAPVAADDMLDQGLIYADGLLTPDSGQTDLIGSDRFALEPDVSEAPEPRRSGTTPLRGTL